MPSCCYLYDTVGKSIMKIAVFGLGYVGCVSAACLAQDGHRVVGVDVNPLKVETIGAGRSPVIEPDLDDLIAETVASGRLTVSLDSQEAVAASDASLICVGTPSNGNGSLQLDYVTNVCAEIGAALAYKEEYHTVVVRSTVLPNTVRGVLIPLLEKYSGKRAGVHFGVAMNPEFLREGSAINDYYHPGVIVIGELDEASGRAVDQIYEAVHGEPIHVDLETAELVKYANNAFHALKITFANEIGNLAKAHHIDGRKVMEILCRDHRLNISPAYLRPGFAFGGSCLPKDMRALLYRAKERDMELPLLHSILPSNQAQIQRAIRLVEATGCKKVGVLGLSFKAGTDDVRESPIIPLIETLVGRGYQVQVYDETVRLDRLIGANKSFLEQEFPHVAGLINPSLHEVVDRAQVLVVANASQAIPPMMELVRPDQVVVDLSGIDNGNGNGKSPSHRPSNYVGICW